MPGVGFQLPPNTKSRAQFIQVPQNIDPSYLPYGPSGNDLSGQGAPVGSRRYAAFYKEFTGRYGLLKLEKNPTGWNLPDAGGSNTLHHTDFDSALRMIAKYNPSFFKQRGWGEWAGDLEPTAQEVQDAYFAPDFIGEALIKESKRLGQLHGDTSSASTNPSTVGGSSGIGSGAGMPRPENYSTQAHYQEDWSLYLRGKPTKGPEYYRQRDQGQNQGTGASSGTPEKPSVEPGKPSENLYADAYKKGYAEGKQAGISEGRLQIVEELQQWIRSLNR